MYPQALRSFLLAALVALAALCAVRGPVFPSRACAGEAGGGSLIEAVEDGDSATLKILLDKGGDPNTVDNAPDAANRWGRGSTLLSIAVQRGDAETVGILLDAGASANKVNDDCKSPLVYAVEMNDLGLVDRLAGGGAKPGAGVPCGMPAIFFARTGPMVEKLVAIGADVDARDENGVTPLMVIAEKGDAAAVGALLAAGADIETRKGVPALHRAARRGNVAAIAPLLATGLDPDTRDPDGDTPLSKALQSDMVEALVACGADVNARNPLKATPLMLVAGERSAEPGAIRALLAAGADVNAVNYLEQTALMMARDGRIAQLLLDAGAGVDAKAVNAMTPLMYAAYEGNTDVAEVLLKGGADVNAHDNENYTPLILAANRNADLVRMLLDAGAGANAATRYSTTALHNAALRDDVVSVELLLAAGADSRIVDKLGRTPAMYARNDELVRILRDAEIRGPSGTGRRP